MSDDELLAQEFEAHRGRLRAVAYRMLGSAQRGGRRRAGDVAAAAPQRGHRQPGRLAHHGREPRVPRHAALADEQARGRARGVRRHRGSPGRHGHPEFEAELADSVGNALLVVLQTLAPAERLAFVLHDLFAVPFDDIATIIGRSPAATRQLASRARRRVQQPEGCAETGDREIVDAFLGPRATVSSSGLLALLDPDAVVRADARCRADGLRGARQRRPGRSPRPSPDGTGTATAAVIDGAAGAAWQRGGETKVAFGFTIVDGLITEIELIADPERSLGPQRVQLV